MVKDMAHRRSVMQRREKEKMEKKKRGGMHLRRGVYSLVRDGSWYRPCTTLFLHRNTNTTLTTPNR